MSDARTPSPWGEPAPAHPDRAASAGIGGPAAERRAAAPARRQTDPAAERRAATPARRQTDPAAERRAAAPAEPRAASPARRQTDPATERRAAGQVGQRGTATATAEGPSRPADRQEARKAGPAPARPPGTPFSFEPDAAAQLKHHHPETRGWRVFRKVRSGVGLIIIALGLGLALAATLGGVVWALAAAIHSAASQ